MEIVVRFFQQGGPFMYPIALILLVGLVITIERFVYLSNIRRTNRLALDHAILPSLRKGDFRQAMKAAQQSGAAIGTVMSEGIARLLNQQSREDVEYAMEEGLMEVLPDWKSEPSTWRPSPMSPP